MCRFLELTLLTTAVVFGYGTICCDAFAQRQVVSWNIEATLVTFDDPAGFFPDVRLGDPVRGTVTYNLATPPKGVFVPNTELYDHRPSFDVTRMTIENPRTGMDVEFIGNMLGPWSSIQMADDFDNLGRTELEDYIYTVRSVLPPPGFTGDNPVVSFLLLGPTTTHSSIDLPSNLNLDDWPIGEIAFYDLYLEDVFGTYLGAEIYSLTAVEVPAIPGDIDGDGDVDSGDYNLWRGNFGYPGLFADDNADGNADGIVDAADYVIWRKAFGSSAGSSSDASANFAVPEPASLVMLMFTAAGWCLRRRRAA